MLISNWKKSASNCYLKQKNYGRTKFYFIQHSKALIKCAFWLGWFYVVSTVVGYLMPNPVYIYLNIRGTFNKFPDFYSTGI